MFDGSICSVILYFLLQMILGHVIARGVLLGSSHDNQTSTSDMASRLPMLQRQRRRPTASKLNRSISVPAAMNDMV